MNAESESLIINCSPPPQYDFDPGSIAIKEELLSDFNLDNEASGTSLNPIKPKSSSTPFCVLCLRECTSDVIVRFSTQPKRNHIDVPDAQRKLEQDLGLTVVLDNTSVVCRACWKLVEIVGDFRECCLKSASWLERFSRVMPYDIESDRWLSRHLFSSMKTVHKAIQDNRIRIDGMNATIALDPSETKVPREGQKKPARKPNSGRPRGSVKHVRVTNSISNQSQSRELLQDQEALNTILALESYRPERDRVKTEFEVQDGSVDEADISDYESIKAPVTLVQALLGDDNHKPSILACDKCGRKFDGPMALRMHVERCPNETEKTKLHTCSICNATFKELCALRFHMNKHNGVRPFKCRKFCDRTFSSNFVRIKHERVICELDGRICPTCGAQLKNEFSLQKHIEAVHGEAKYSCSKCPKAFRTSRMLWKHQRVHSEERKYNCEVCGKGYKSAYAVKVHMRTHTQEKPFACHLCDQAFNYKVSMKSHIERHHGQIT